jgi:predicted transcriptional regulator
MVGRPPYQGQETRSKVTTIRLTPSMHAMVEKLAAKDRRTPTDWMRVLIEEEAERRRPEVERE